MAAYPELDCSAPEAAKRLLGCEIERTLPGGVLMRGMIVETEAYDETDPGSHTYKGRSARNSTMFGPAGHLYVYFIYGMYYCCNIVVGQEDYGSGVLIRAIQPICGENEMAKHRPNQTGKNLTNGPGKLCKALDITRELDGHDLNQLPVKLIIKPPIMDNIVQTTRIGLSRGAETSWRFYVSGNEYVSKK